MYVTICPRRKKVDSLIRLRLQGNVLFWGGGNWDTVFDKHEPYAIIRDNPRRGLIRSR